MTEKHHPFMVGFHCPQCARKYELFPMHIQSDNSGPYIICNCGHRHNLKPSMWLAIKGAWGLKTVQEKPRKKKKSRPFIKSLREVAKRAGKRIVTYQGSDFSTMEEYIKAMRRPPISDQEVAAMDFDKFFGEDTCSSS